MKPNRRRRSRSAPYILQTPKQWWSGRRTRLDCSELKPLAFHMDVPWVLESSSISWIALHGRSFCVAVLHGVWAWPVLYRRRWENPWRQNTQRFWEMLVCSPQLGQQLCWGVMPEPKWLQGAAAREIHARGRSSRLAAQQWWSPGQNITIK